MSLKYNKKHDLNPLPASLPLMGLKRASEILPFLPFGKTTLWEWSKNGRFPAPKKISANMTCWDCASVHAWLAKHGQSAANDAGDV